MFATDWPSSPASSSTDRSPWARTSTSSALRPLPSAFATPASPAYSASFSARPPTARPSVLKNLLDKHTGTARVFKRILDEGGPVGEACRSPAGGRPVPRLGLRANAAQFGLLVGVNALVGGMLGQERTVLPLLAEQEFGLEAYTVGLTFILAFGVAKAATNYLAGTWSDRYGRKPVLVAGWLVAVPVPLLLIWAPVVGLGRGGERPAGGQPGADLVHHRHHEDRPRRARAAAASPWA